MVKQSAMNKPWRIILPEALYLKLRNHLFPGDGDEHGAIILASLAEAREEVRLLARDLHLARDGQDYVPGKRGYRMLRAEFITSQVLKARDEHLVYLAVHNHSGFGRVAFSGDDLRSHERGYPSLVQVTRGIPVGALVFAEDAVAGDLWLSYRRRVSLRGAIIVGTKRQFLNDRYPRSTQSDPRYDRQTLMFGERGQKILSKAKVAIVGLGGVGSLVAEYIARLGVRRFVLVDPDRAESTNLPRLIGARRSDTGPKLLTGSPVRWLRAVGRRLARHKVDLAKRNIMGANPEASVERYAVDFVESKAIDHIKDSDYMFLAADTMRARLLFNAIVHQYLIPGVQLGAKIVGDKSGNISNVYAVTRPITPGSGCLLCNHLINPTKLQEESLPEEERRGLRYVNDDAVTAPSVITLNALASAQAANDFMFYMTGLADEAASSDYMRFLPARREVCWDKPRSSPECTHCGNLDHGILARGDSVRLPAMWPGAH